MPLTRAWLKPLLDRRVAPGGLGRPACVALDRTDSGKAHQPLGGVRPAIEQHVLHLFAADPGGISSYTSNWPGVDDRHVQPGADRVIEKRGVHRPADRLVAAEGERDVAHAAGNSHLRETAA